jgi:hypothetical protein
VNDRGRGDFEERKSTGFFVRIRRREQVEVMLLYTMLMLDRRSDGRDVQIGLDLVGCFTQSSLLWLFNVVIL